MSSTKTDETISKLKDTVDELLSITHPLVEQHPSGSGAFLRVLEVTYRRSYHTLQAIRALGDEPHLSSPSFILTRSLIEDVVAIEYMIATDQEKKAKRFQDFRWIQAMDDLEYAKSRGLGKDLLLGAPIKAIKREFAAVKKQFIYKKKPDIVLARSWDAKQVDQMLEEILKLDPPKFGESDRKNIARLYLLANRKTHFNPIDLIKYLDQDVLKDDYKQTMQESLLAAVSCYIRLTTRYRDEISHSVDQDMYSDIARRAVELLKALDT